MRVTTSQYEIYLIRGQNSHLLRQNVFLQSIIYSSLRKHPFLLAQTFPAAKSEEKRMFSQAKSTLDRENNSLDQAAFLHEVKVVWFLPILLF